jgi:hypothetical protein
MTEGLFVDSRKWPDTSHWHYTMFWLGEDEHGRWYVLPGGATVQKGNDPERKFPATSAILVQEGAWWFAHWNTDPGSPALYIDVSTPSRIENGVLHTVDLDLDVIRDRDGRVEVIDQDEFLLHQKQLAYPDELIENAERSAREIEAAVTRGDEPFGKVGDQWLERAVAWARNPPAE